MSLPSLFRRFYFSLLGDYNGIQFRAQMISIRKEDGFECFSKIYLYLGHKFLRTEYPMLGKVQIRMSIKNLLAQEMVFLIHEADPQSSL